MHSLSSSSSKSFFVPCSHRAALKTSLLLFFLHCSCTQANTVLADFICAEKGRELKEMFELWEEE